MMKLRTVFLVLGILLESGCGPQQLSTYFNSTVENTTKVAILQNQGNELLIFIAYENNVEQLDVCFGEVSNCQRENAEFVFAAKRVKEIGGKTLYQIQDPIRYDETSSQINIHIATGRDFSTKILRSIVLSRSTQSDITAIPPIPESGQAGSFKLAMPPVHQQGATNYCWAYASFHTLRTYFIHNRPVNASYGEWKSFVKTYDESSKFASFMRKTFQNSSGNTYRFVTGLRNVVGLPSAFKWNGDSEGGHLKKVLAKLHKGQPTPFCDGRHCTAIYGYETNGTSPTYFYIADSSAPRSKGVIKRSVTSVLNNNFYPFYMRIEPADSSETSLMPEVPDGWENRPETFGSKKNAIDILQ